MEERASGIILRTRPLTESSLIVQWITPEWGRISTVAKGARRAKSPFLGKLDLFYTADFSMRRSRRSELHTLCEVNVRDFHSALREDLGRLWEASYFAHFLEQTTETETPLPGLFELFAEALEAVHQSPADPLLVLAFEAKSLSHLGLQPDFAQVKMTAGARGIIEKCILLGWGELHRIRPSAAQITEIAQFLHGFLIYHLGRLPKGRSTALLAHSP